MSIEKNEGKNKVPVTLVSVAKSFALRAFHQAGISLNGRAVMNVVIGNTAILTVHSINPLNDQELAEMQYRNSDLEINQSGDLITISVSMADVATRFSGLNGMAVDDSDTVEDAGLPALMEEARREVASRTSNQLTDIDIWFKEGDQD
ncbi:hypothetical protein COU74_00315 [Candidatus Peregrinibacteria bacterium CG10_big_fil_rev_8_21_14_0_10_36_19]|nr:MAG: hypothetical protein COU74_00315 [Candidatus Peregrinibacteria bacterium CG10_big_fil_rev_8_21_14_0_10_36_19]